MKRAAIYLRVSTDEQSAANQRPDLEKLATARGFEVVDVYEEQASAVKARSRFDKMLSDAHRGRFEVLLIWALDRLGRSMVGNLLAVLELDRRGVKVISVREPWLDMEGPVRNLLLAIFSWVAEQERAQLIARTHAGLARARKRGIRLGRPQSRLDLELALKLRVEGLSLRQIAKRLGVAPMTLHGALRRTEKGSSKVGA